MDIVEPGGKPLHSFLSRWGALGLTAAGFLCVGAAEIAPSPITAAPALILALIPIALALSRPPMFELVGRGGVRGLNPMFAAPAVWLFLGGLRLDVIEWAPGWIAAVVGAVAGALAAWIAGKRLPVARPRALIIVATLAGWFYAYGALMMADARFDGSAGTLFRVTVTGGETYHGRRSTTYSLSLAPWGPFAEENDVDVPAWVHDGVNIGDPVCVTLFPGALGMRWYRVDLCPDRPSGGTTAP